MDEDRHLCTDFELCPVCQLCEGGCCECTEQERLFPMADSEEIAMEAIFEARRLTEADAARVQRRPWLTSVVGYIVDGKVWHPSDVTIVRRENRQETS